MFVRFLLFLFFFVRAFYLSWPWDSQHTFCSSWYHFHSVCKIGDRTIYYYCLYLLRRRHLTCSSPFPSTILHFHCIPLDLSTSIHAYGNNKNSCLRRRSLEGSLLGKRIGILAHPLFCHIRNPGSIQIRVHLPAKS